MWLGRNKPSMKSTIITSFSKDKIMHFNEIILLDAAWNNDVWAFCAFSTGSKIRKTEADVDDNDDDGKRFSVAWIIISLIVHRFYLTCVCDVYIVKHRPVHSSVRLNVITKTVRSCHCIIPNTFYFSLNFFHLSHKCHKTTQNVVFNVLCVYLCHIFTWEILLRCSSQDEII